MLLSNQTIIEKWRPDFSASGVADPIWTRLRYGKTILCNSLEWAEWSSNPVQVELCDVCGTAGCASGGYVHVSALGDTVLWTMPNWVTETDVGEGRLFPATVIEKFGSVAFPVGVWDSLRVAAAEVPTFGSLARAGGHALRDAWAIGQSRPKALDRLVPLLRECLVGADTLDVGDAIQWIEHWLQWFDERVANCVEGTLASPETTGSRIETLYFDGPGTADWTALAEVNGSFVPAFSPNHIFIPGG